MNLKDIKVKANVSSGGTSSQNKISTEDDLIAELKRMHTAYRQKELSERKEDAASALPEEPDYEFKTYEGESEEEIKDRVTNEYNDKLESEQKVAAAATKSKTDELEKKAESAYDDFGKTEQEILESLESTKKSNENAMIKNGLSRSSIRELAGESAEKQAENMIAEAKADAENVAAKYRSQIDDLNGQLQAAIDDLNAEYVIKISSEIEDLISKRDKELKSIQEYNNTVEKQIADYKLEREKAIQDDLTARMQADYQQAEYEKRYGYVGEKADDYAERLNIAIGFYDTLDPGTAKDMIVSNPYLQTYLGYEYTNLLSRYVKKAKNS